MYDNLDGSRGSREEGYLFLFSVILKIHQVQTNQLDAKH